MTGPQWQVVRRPLLLLATWVTGTIVAMVVAWQAVTLVGHQVTESRPSELSPRELIARTVPTSTTTTTAAVHRATSTTVTTALVATTDPSTRPGRTTTRAHAVGGFPDCGCASPGRTGNPPRRHPPRRHLGSGGSGAVATCDRRTGRTAASGTPGRDRTTSRLVDRHLHARWRFGRGSLPGQQRRTGVGDTERRIQCAGEGLRARGRRHRVQSDQHRSRLRVRCENGQHRPAASEEDTGDAPG